MVTRPFPHDKDKSLEIPGEVVPVFCLCRQLDADKMIACDECGEWYHSHCLGNEQIPGRTQTLSGLALGVLNKAPGVPKIILTWDPGPQSHMTPAAVILQYWISTARENLEVHFST